MTLVPKLKVPMKFTAGAAELVEQGSIDEIGQCAEAIIRYPTQFRIDLPEFGLPDQAFQENGPDLDLIEQVVRRWEPRGEAVTQESTPDGLTDLIEQITLNLRGPSA